MSDSSHRPQKESRYEFGDLNPLGKSVFIAGAAVRGASFLLDRAIEHVTDVVVETERSFREGRDPNIDDARILDEEESRR